MRRAALGLAVAVLTWVPTAVAPDWSRFYQRAEPAPVVEAVERLGPLPRPEPERFGPLPRPSANGPRARPRQTAQAPVAVCLQAIFAAQARYGIPNNLLLGLGLQEAGVVREGRLTVWPWAVNAEGEGRIFASRAQAIAWVEARLSEGMRSIDVGCLQINLRWHPEAFRSVAEGFDPAINVNYAARFLRRLYDESGDWTEAAGRYHSRTADKQKIYLDKFERNLAVANDRLDQFLADAGAPQVVRPLPAPERPGRVPVTAGLGWSADLSRDGAGRRLSLYSDAELQPILPNFAGG